MEKLNLKNTIYNSLIVVLLFYTTFLQLKMVQYGWDEILMYFNIQTFSPWHWFVSEWGFNHGYYRPLQVILQYPIMYFLELTGFKYGLVFNFLLLTFLSLYIFYILQKYISLSPFQAFLITLLFSTNSIILNSFTYLTDNSNFIIIFLFLYLYIRLYYYNEYNTKKVIFIIFIAPFFKESGIVLAAFYCMVVFVRRYNFNLKSTCRDINMWLTSCYVIIFIIFRFLILNIYGNSSLYADMFNVNNILFESFGHLSRVINFFYSILNIIQFKLAVIPYTYYSHNYFNKLLIVTFLWMILYVLVVKMNDKSFNVLKNSFPMVVTVIISSLLCIPYFAERIQVVGFVAFILVFASLFKKVVKKTLFFINLILLVIIIFQVNFWKDQAKAQYNVSLQHKYNSVEELHEKIYHYVQNEKLLNFLYDLRKNYPPLQDIKE